MAEGSPCSTIEKAITAWNTRAQSTPPEQRASDGPCRKCGHPCECWFAESKLWNQVNGGETGLLCLRCFVAQAESMGIDKHAWELTQDLRCMSESAHPEAVRMPIELPQLDVTVEDKNLAWQNADPTKTDYISPGTLRASFQCRERQLLAALAELQTERAAHERTRAKLEQFEEDCKQQCNEETCQYFNEDGWPINDEYGCQWHNCSVDRPKPVVLCEAYRDSPAHRRYAELESLRAERK